MSQNSPVQSIVEHFSSLPEPRTELDTAPCAFGYHRHHHLRRDLWRRQLGGARTLRQRQNQMVPDIPGIASRALAALAKPADQPCEHGPHATGQRQRLFDLLFGDQLQRHQ